MYAQLFPSLLFACRVILTEFYDFSENVNTVGVEKSPTARPAALTTGYVMLSDVNAAYRIHEKGMTWYEARDRCIAEGAHLVIPDSMETIVHLGSLKTSSSFIWLHAGIFRSNTTNQWTRVDNGLPATSIPWIEGYPDGAGDCAGVSINQDGVVNYPCHWEGDHYVCEKSI